MIVGSWCRVAVFVLLTAIAMGSPKKILLCYYEAHTYFPVTEVPSDLCTHIVYSFGQVTRTGISPTRQSDLSRYRTLTNLKKKNTNLKILLSLQQGFDLAVDAGIDVMKNFSQSATKFLTTNGFDGVDLDWEFPNTFQKDAYRTFIQIFSSDLKKANLLLSAALPNNPYLFKAGYDPQTLAKCMDFMTVMAYDFHLYNKKDNTTGYNSPLYTPKGEAKYLSTSAMIEFYITSGIPANKLLMGIPSYGRSWKLANPANHNLHSPAVGKGDPSPYFKLRGVYLFSDICLAMQLGFIIVPDYVNIATYIYDKSDWVAIDIYPTATVKIVYMERAGLGGVGIWALHLDDIAGVCKGGRLPFVSYIKKFMNRNDVYNDNANKENNLVIKMHQ